MSRALNYSIVLMSIIAILFVVQSAFAVPPASPYVPGDAVLDPTCNPGDVNCFVQTENIYNADDTITGDRRVIGNDNALRFGNPNAGFEDVLSSFDVFSGDLAGRVGGIGTGLDPLGFGWGDGAMMVSADAASGFAAVFSSLIELNRR